MADATTVVQMVSRLKWKPPISRVTCSPTGMLTDSTPAALSIAAARPAYLLALVTGQRDHGVQQHHGLEDGQASDDPPTEGGLDHQQADGNRSAHTQADGNAAGERLAVEYPLRGGEAQGGGLEYPVIGHRQGQPDDQARGEQGVSEQHGEGAADDPGDNAGDHRAAHDTLYLRQREGS